MTDISIASSSTPTTQSIDRSTTIAAEPTILGTVNAPEVASPAPSDSTVAPSATSPTPIASSDADPSISLELTPVGIEQTKFVIQDSLAIMAHNLHHILLRNPAFRGNIVRYLKAATYPDTVPAIFVQRCMTQWSDVRQVNVDDEEQKGFFDPKMIAMAEQFKGTDSFLLLIDYTPLEMQCYALRCLAVITLRRTEEGAAGTRKKETYDQSIARQTEHSDFIISQVQYDIINIVQPTKESQVALKALFRAEMDRRLVAARDFAFQQFPGDVREACVQFGVHEQIIVADTLHAKEHAGAPLMPMRCVRIVCGGHDAARVHILALADVVDLRRRLLETGSPPEDQVVSAYSDVIANLEKPRTKPFVAVVMVIRGLYGPCAAHPVCQTAVVDMQAAGEGATEERARRVQIQNESKAALAKMKKLATQRAK